MKKKIISLFLALILTASLAVGCQKKGSNTNGSGNMQITQDDTAQNNDSLINDNAVVSFRPAECGILAQDNYDYPYMGLSARLSDTMLEQVKSFNVQILTKEEYNSDWTKIRYAFLNFFTLTEEQKNRETESYDPNAWEAELSKLGTLGLYQSDLVDQLDELTGCDTHTKLGESADGSYHYYLSTASSADASLIKEFEKTKTTITEMRQLDPQDTFSAFSIGRTEGVSNVGDFTTKDVYGKTYTSDMFKDYDLTLVNVMTTWCSSCVEEIPDLEKMRKDMASKGVNVIAVVLDTVNENGEEVDEIIEKSRLLAGRSGVSFPFLLPDSTNMNDRLKGLESFPESFFVDKEGNIVGNTYAGSNTATGWQQIVEKELASLKENIK